MNDLDRGYPAPTEPDYSPRTGRKTPRTRTASDYRAKQKQVARRRAKKGYR